MNPTDEVLAKAELPEMAGSDDWLSKFDERYRAALKDVQKVCEFDVNRWQREFLMVLWGITGIWKISIQHI